MNKQFLRTQLILGEENLKKLHQSSVVIVGLGAVGSFCSEILARMGVGQFLLVDKDHIEDTNINRQIFALHSTLGDDKVKVAENRMLDINPKVKIKTLKTYLNPENIDLIFENKPDIIIDAVDIIRTKVALIMNAQKHNIPIVCSMGAAMKTDLSAIKIAKLNKTKNCPLAMILRKKLRKLEGNLNVPCVYSEELPVILEHNTQVLDAKEILGSLSYITGAFGLYLAQLSIKELLQKKLD